MTLMLVVIFLFVALGLAARRVGPREHVGIAALAFGMTVLYLLFARFM